MNEERTADGYNHEVWAAVADIVHERELALGSSEVEGSEGPIRLSAPIASRSVGGCGSRDSHRPGARVANLALGGAFSC